MWTKHPFHIHILSFKKGTENDRNKIMSQYWNVNRIFACITSRNTEEKKYLFWYYFFHFFSFFSSYLVNIILLIITLWLSQYIMWWSLLKYILLHIIIDWWVFDTCLNRFLRASSNMFVEIMYSSLKSRSLSFLSLLMFLKHLLQIFNSKNFTFKGNLSMRKCCCVIRNELFWWY